MIESLLVSFIASLSRFILISFSMKPSHHLETSNFQRQRDLTDLNASVRHSGALLFITLCISTVVCLRNRSDKGNFPTGEQKFGTLPLNLKNSESKAVSVVASVIPNPVVFYDISFWLSLKA